MKRVTRKKLTKPPVFAQMMQDEFGKATRQAAARAELAGVAVAGPRAKAKKLTPIGPAKIARVRQKA